MKPRRLFPSASTDLPALEQWLAQQAAQGLFPEGGAALGSLLTCRRDAPQALQYHILVQDRQDYRSAEQLEAAYAALGWHYVCRLWDLYAVFSAAPDAPPFPPPEPSAQAAAVRRMIRRHRTALLAMWAGVLFLVLLAFVLLRRRPSPWDPLGAGLLAPQWIFLVTTCLSGCAAHLHALRTVKRMDAGRPIPRRLWLVRLYTLAPPVSLLAGAVLLLALMAGATPLLFV